MHGSTQETWVGEVTLLDGDKFAHEFTNPMDACEWVEQVETMFDYADSTAVFRA